jgi:hypothetical protein
MNRDSPDDVEGYACRLPAGAVAAILRRCLLYRSDFEDQP